MTYNGTIEAGPYQIFSLTGSGVVSGFSKVDKLYPEWWGSNADAFKHTLSAGMASGKPLILTQASYDLSSGYSAVTLTGNLRMRAADGVHPTITGNTFTDFVTMAGYSLDVEGIKWDTWDYVFNFSPLTVEVPEIRVHNCKFSNLASGALTGDNYNEGSQVSNMSVSDCLFDTMKWAIRIRARTIYNVKVNNNHFENIAKRGVCLGSDAYEYDDTRTTYRIAGNTFKNITTDVDENINAILVYGYSGDISGNLIDTVESGGTSTAAGIYAKCRYNSIRGNTVIDGGYQAFISMKGDPIGSGASEVLGHSQVCVGNKLKSTSSYEASHSTGGILINSDHILVQGNILEGFKNHFVEFESTSGTVGIIVADNLGVDFRGNEPIRCKATGGTITFSGNHFECGGGTKGIYLTPINDAEPTKFIIKDNYILDAVTAIHLAGAGGSKGYISYIIRNNTIDKVTDGITISTSNPLYLEVVGNSFYNVSDNVFEFSSYAATDYFIEGNKGITVQTTDATATTIVPEIKLDTNKTAYVEASCIGSKRGGGDKAAYKEISLLYENGSGTVVQQGATTSLFADESDSNWNFAVEATGQSVRARVTGAAATTVDWEMVDFKLVTR
ncbi:MAG: hypothetical protein P8X58_08685 [Syntrophobacterales bacterium]